MSTKTINLTTEQQEIYNRHEEAINNLADTYVEDHLHDSFRKDLMDLLDKVSKPNKEEQEE